MQLYFYIDERYNSTSGYLTGRLLGINKPKLSEEFNKGVFRVLISTQVAESSLHLLALDCDSREDVGKAVQDLNVRGIGYALIESSPFHFWIITDFIGSVSECISVMNNITGTHSEYITWARRQGDLFLRAFPRNGFRPILGEISFRLSCGKAFEWFKAFSGYWHSQVIEDAINYQLSKGFTSGKETFFKKDLALRVSERYRFIRVEKFCYNVD